MRGGSKKVKMHNSALRGSGPLLSVLTCTMDLYLSEETDQAWFRPLQVVLPCRWSEILPRKRAKVDQIHWIWYRNYNGENGGPHFTRVWHHPKMFESPLTFFDWRYRSILRFKSIQSFWEPLELELCNFFSKDPPPSWRYFNNHVHIIIDSVC